MREEEGRQVGEEESQTPVQLWEGPSQTNGAGWWAVGRAHAAWEMPCVGWGWAPLACLSLACLSLAWALWWIQKVWQWTALLPAGSLWVVYLPDSHSAYGCVLAGWKGGRNSYSSIISSAFSKWSKWSVESEKATETEQVLEGFQERHSW